MLTDCKFAEMNAEHNKCMDWVGKKQLMFA